MRFSGVRQPPSQACKEVWKELHPDGRFQPHPMFELKPFDAAREQHNTGVWSRAMKCRELGYSFEETLRFLDEWTWLNQHLFQREIPEAETRKQVRQAFERLDTKGTAWRHKDPNNPPGQKPTKKPGKPVQDAELIAEIDDQLHAYTLAELRGSSPVEQEAASLPWLFEPDGNNMRRFRASMNGEDPLTLNPWLCWGFFRWCDVDKKPKPQVRTRQDWTDYADSTLEGQLNGGNGFKMLWAESPSPTAGDQGLSVLRSNGKRYSPRFSEYTFPELIVPNPMRGPTGTASHGRPSNRCLDNSTRPENRLFWVVDIDTNPDGTPGVCWDSQARRLLWLSGGMRLVMVVHSGGKSLQGWFSPQTPKAREDIDEWVALAVSVGADPSAFVPSQPVRFPWGLRRNRDKKTGVLSPEKPYTMQEVYYLDQAPGLVTKGGFSC